MDATVKWFQVKSEDTPNKNPWHAFRLEAPGALCGKAAINYGFDAVVDLVPLGGEAHKACLKAMAKAEKT